MTLATEHAGARVGARIRWIRPDLVVHRRPLRTGVLADFQLICGVGDYELDILVREHEAPLRLEIGGQVTRANEVHVPVPGLELTLLDATAETVVTSTSTDEFGEFVFDSQSQDRYGIRIGIAPDAPCVILTDGGSK
jgi:hypothetical protein